MNITELDQQLRSRTIAPIYLLIGPEIYLRNSAIERICAARTPDNSRRTDAAKVSVAEVIDAAQSLGLFEVHQVLIVGDVSEWGTEGEALLTRYGQSPNSATTLILWAAKLDQRTKIAQRLMSSATVIECKSLYANQIPDWVRIECGRRGREISREAARLLAEAVGTELGTVHQTIEKVFLYTEGKRLIGVEDVEAVVLETSQRTIFELLNAIGHRDQKNAIRLLERILIQGEPAVRIGTMIAWHWRILFRANVWLQHEEGNLAAALKVSPYFAKDYAVQAQGFTLAMLNRGFTILASADRALKRSRVPGKTILTQAVMQLVSSPQG